MPSPRHFVSPRSPRRVATPRSPVIEEEGSMFHDVSTPRGHGRRKKRGTKKRRKN